MQQIEGHQQATFLFDRDIVRFWEKGESSLIGERRYGNQESRHCSLKKIKNKKKEEKTGVDGCAIERETTKGTIAQLILMGKTWRR